MDDFPAQQRLQNTLGSPPSLFFFVSSPFSNPPLPHANSPLLPFFSLILHRSNLFDLNLSEWHDDQILSGLPSTVCLPPPLNENLLFVLKTKLAPPCLPYHLGEPSTSSSFFPLPTPRPSQPPVTWIMQHKNNGPARPRYMFEMQLR